MKKINLLLKLNNFAAYFLFSLALGPLVQASAFNESDELTLTQLFTLPKPTLPSVFPVVHASPSTDQFDEDTPQRERYKKPRLGKKHKSPLIQGNTEEGDDSESSMSSLDAATGSSSSSQDEENIPVDFNLSSLPTFSPLRPQPLTCFSPFTPKTLSDFKRKRIDPETYKEVVLCLFQSPQRRPLSIPHTLPTVRNEKIQQALLQKKFFCQQALIEAGNGHKLRSQTPSDIVVHGKRRPALVLSHQVGVVEEPRETREARIAREKQQTKLIKQARQHQFALTNPDAVSKESAQISLYICYLSLRKQKVDPDNLRDTLIRKAEIEDVVDDLFKDETAPDLEENQATYWRLEISGYVIFMPTFFDYTTKDTFTGESGLDRMRRCLAPFDPHGDSTHLHHATLYDKKTHHTTSYLIAMSHAEHESHHSGLHFTDTHYWMPKAPVDRNLFGHAKKEIYPAVADFIEKRLSHQ